MGTIRLNFLASLTLSWTALASKSQGQAVGSLQKDWRIHLE